MTNLNYIYLGWFINKNQKIEEQIKLALVSWNKRKDTRDIKPNSIVFNDEDKGLVNANVIYELDVIYSNKSLKKHFFIRGTTD